jgi:RimJ/RimL family protein N-acetyltransferase
MVMHREHGILIQLEQSKEMNERTLDDLPVGEPEHKTASSELPRREFYSGNYVTLMPVNAEMDVQELYDCSHGSEQESQLWTYMPYGPFSDQEAMLTWLKECQESTDTLFVTVHVKESAQRIGMASFLNIVPDMLRLELGHIWYSPIAQRTKINTETIYLMLCESFDQLGYRRVEWKCDSLNARSCAAALRLGFSFEGVFRKHVITKGRNRDTSWFAMTDDDWPAVKKNMGRWLYSGEENLSLSDLNVTVSNRT